MPHKKHDELRPMSAVVEDLSQKYNVPFEIVESILVDWVKLLLEGIRDSDDNEPRSLLDN